MASKNLVILIGNLGADPEIRYAPSGDAIANFRLATTDKYKDKATGEQKESTEWHSCTTFGRQAEIIREYVKKGSSLYIEGTLRTRKWQDKDGNDRYTTEVRVLNFQMLGGRGNGGGSGDDDGGQRSEGRPTSGRAARQSQPAGTRNTPVNEFDDDSIPF